MGHLPAGAVLRQENQDLSRSPLCRGLRSPFGRRPDEDDADRTRRQGRRREDRPGRRRETLAGGAGAGRQLPRLAVNDKAIFWLSPRRPARRRRSPSRRRHPRRRRGRSRPDRRREVVRNVGGRQEAAGAQGGHAATSSTRPPAAADLANKDGRSDGLDADGKPREEWRQMFAEAWRLERDYFYDRSMHGVDWKDVRKKYEPLVERVASRDELADLVGADGVGACRRCTSSSAAATRGKGDDGSRRRPGGDAGATRPPAATASSTSTGPTPTSRRGRRRWPEPSVDVKEGDVIEAVNGTPTAVACRTSGRLLRPQGRQAGAAAASSRRGGKRRATWWSRRSTPTAAADLRYHEWEYTRRAAGRGGEQGRDRLRPPAGDGRRGLRRVRHASFIPSSPGRA